MNDLAEVQGHDLIEVATGRHALEEDAVLTPIFSAVCREVLPDAVDQFHRDPLTAPIPIQVLVPHPAQSMEQRVEDGRHHVHAS